MQRFAIAGGAVALILVVIGAIWGKGALSHADSARAHAAPKKLELDASELDPDNLHGGDARAPRSAHVAALAASPLAHGTISTETTRSSIQAPIATSRITDGQDGSLSRIEYKFGHAKSFKDALVRCGASGGEADEVIGALQKLVDFRRCKPEDHFIFERDAELQLRAFEYRASITEVYRAVRDEHDDLRGLKVDIPIERRRIAQGIFIAGTLGHSLEALGLGASLAGLVTEAFNAKISFTRDTRAGDSVKIIVDQEYVDGNFLRYGVVHAIEYASERVGKLQAYWYQPEHGDGDFYDSMGRALHGSWLRTPVRYDHISSPYNLKRRHPILKRIMPHLGIDYSASTGTPVWAAASGQITFAGPRGPNGNLVSLRHDNGYESHYAHLWKIGPGLKPGIRLQQRQVLGFVGSTGRSTGPHLHFAMKRSGHFIDPASLFNGPGEPLPASQQSQFRAEAQRLRAELEQIPLSPAPTTEDTAKPDDDEEDDDDLDL